MIELTKAEEQLVLDMRRREAQRMERERRERELSVLRRDGAVTVARYTGGHHGTYGVYDGEELVCVCVYKKGAFALVDYINKLKGEMKCGS